MKTLLLVEDDRVMRENTAEILELAGYQVAIAENGKVGAQLAKKIRPDLIICDIMMPELDGYGMLHILSKDPGTAAIPFIFLTAKAEKSEMRRGMELGADDYLTKPFEETELLNAIESRLRKREVVLREFSRNLEGLNQFIDEVRGVKDLEALSRNRPLVSYKKKETIYHEGDVPQQLFFLNKGKVKVQKLHDDGKEYIVGLNNPGEFFGYIPLLKGSPYSESAVAFEACEVCKIPKDDFLSLIFKNREISGKFIRMLSDNIVEKEKQLLSLAYDTVRKRVAEALLSLENRYRQAGKGPARIAVTREDLAGMAGTASETVIRSLGDFKEEGLIEVQGREILILNPEGLRGMR